MIAARLVKVSLRARTDLDLALLARQVLLGQGEGIGRLVVVVIGLGQVGRIDNREHLAPLDAIAQCHLELQHTAGQRRENGRGARRTGADWR